MNTDKLNKNDKKYEKTINLLKGLQKVDAPDDFEFKLMTRIHNKNFDINEEIGKNKLFSWKLAPAAALVVSAVIIFFVFDLSDFDSENPFVIDPPKRLDAGNLKADTVEIEEILVESREPNLTESLAAEVSDEKKVEEESVISREQYRIVLQPNDAVSKEKIDLPFETGAGLELDRYIGESSPKKDKESPSRLVRSGSGVDFDFEGFYLRMYENELMMKELKAEMDSLIDFHKRKRDSLLKQDTTRTVQ